MAFVFWQGSGDCKKARRALSGVSMAMRESTEAKLDECLESTTLSLHDGFALLHGKLAFTNPLPVFALCEYRRHPRVDLCRVSGMAGRDVIEDNAPARYDACICCLLR